MALGYNFQNNYTLLGTRSSSTITAAATLATAYAAAATKVFTTGGHSKANFNIRYTMGASETSNSLELRFSTSPDNVVYHQIVNESVSGGTSTLTKREFTIVGTNAGTHDFSLPLDLFDKWMKLEAKETGVAANYGTVYVDVTLSGAK